MISVRSLRGKFLDCIYFLHSSTRKLQKDKLVSDLDNKEKIDPEVTRLVDDRLSTLSVEWLEKRLRQVPYWVNGHLHLADLALNKNDVAAAYASACAVNALTQDTVKLNRADHILARCYLRKGMAQKALLILEKLIARNPQRLHFVLEDLAAAHLALGNYSEAHLAFKQISEDKISAEGRAALQYLKNKQN